MTTRARASMRFAIAGGDRLPAMTLSKTEQIQAFLPQLRSRLTTDQCDDIVLYAREEEWHLAVELIGEFFQENAAGMTRDDWTIFSNLAGLVHLDLARFHDLRPSR